MKRLLLVAARTVGLVVLGLTLLLIGCQSRLIYYPRAYSPREEANFLAQGGSVLSFSTPEGIQRARFLPGRSPNAPVWLWCPGNASLALDYLDEARRWDPEAGWLFIDYPGYGGNPGRPSPETVAHTVAGAVNALATHLGTPQESLAPRLGAAGQSLGAAAALIAADDLQLNRVVLVAPFTTLTEMGRRLVGWPLCHLNRHRYDNRTRLAAVTRRGGRVWIVHGVDDEIIPVNMARTLAALAPSAVRLTEVPLARHNDLWYVAPDLLPQVFREAGHR